MPNIALLNYCNLNCPYCFANKFIEEEKQLLSIEQLDNILNFLSQEITSIQKIGLIGGEPTLHPQFEQILIKIINFCNMYNIKKPIVFSNGILIKKYAKFFANDATLLLNLNSPNVIGEENWDKILDGIDFLGILGALKYNTTFGFNIYPTMKDYEYIFKLAKKYNQPKIRCSYVAPANNFLTKNKEEYYINGKKIFLDICDMALQYNIQLKLDCNRIPLCYFNDIEQKKINNICTNNITWCNPIIDITPDFKATCCFGTYNTVDLTDFNNIEEVKRYFLFNETYPRIKQNNLERCKSCKKFSNYICSGGCLGFG